MAGATPSSSIARPSAVRFLSRPGSESPSRERGGTASTVQTVLSHVQTRAQGQLSNAIALERAKRWAEAIDHYQKLLHSLTRSQLPLSFIPGPDYAQLLLETYYHIGVALQKLDRHRKALQEFTNAIEVSHIPKYACQVGCISKTFYHTPVYARRAYANVKCGRMKEAMYDANKAATLDSSNPDVYCIRALVWSSANENRRALVDLNTGLKLNPSHLCTLILRGAILNTLGAVSVERNKDHQKAFKICQDSQQYFDVQSFHSPKMPAFFDRFLWSLTAFHTITKINLFEGAVFAVQSQYRRSSSLAQDGRGGMGNSDDRQNRLKGPFKCGSVATYSDNTALLRRKVYSKLLTDSNIGLTENNVHRRKSLGSESTKAGTIQEETSKHTSDNPMAALFGMENSKPPKFKDFL